MHTFGVMMNASPSSSSLTRALSALTSRQSSKGALTGDYSGPLFLLPLYVSACYACDQMPEASVREEMIHYLRAVQNDDGGFGLGEENPSCVFTTVLNYVTLRLLGVPDDDPDAMSARAWFRARGGALGSASWGRFILCVLNLHDYRGLHPIPPELWLLPYSLPMHPGRMWCHARMVYLPMSWLYGQRAQIPLDPLLIQLRSELYETPYDQIKWSKVRDSVHPVDAYTPHTRPLKIANSVMHGYEHIALPGLRKKACAEALRQIDYEDRITSYICIGPVNKVYNTLVWHFAKPEGEEVRSHLAQLPEYLHTDARGTRMNGYNNSQLWDTAFGIQAALAAQPHVGPEATAPYLTEAHRFLRDSYLHSDPPQREDHYRCPSKGGWPFSDQDHGWPITDCTAEGLKCALLLQSSADNAFTEEELAQSVELLLYWQNPNGGWASYERTRAPQWLEWFNPSDIFGDIMIDYAYTECTSAVLQGLHAWQSREGATADPRVDAAMARGQAFLLEQQRQDGSWFGSWGVCFTYGTWFGVWGLLASGLPKTHPAIQRACDFLFTLQREDGSWGEHIDSCAQGTSLPTEEGQVVMTSWALMTLISAGKVKEPAVQRGLSFLRDRQNPDGSWDRENIAGVFNKTCSITYDNYRQVFPLWALSMAEQG